MTMTTPTRSIAPVEFPGPAGRLVGLLHRPGVPPRFLAVASHPHPLHGGTMDNRVIYRVARSLDAAGAVVLRFNFRGVRGSEGEHDDGHGEQDDLRAAIAHVVAAHAADAPDQPGLPLVLAGFSFGSVMSSLVATAGMPGLAGLLLVGAPVLRHRFEELAMRVPAWPVACVQGGRDEHGPLPELEAVWSAITEPKRLVVVPSAGHFFEAEQQDLADAVASILMGTFRLA